jgi:hypothetical protein
MIYCILVCFREYDQLVYWLGLFHLYGVNDLYKQMYKVLCVFVFLVCEGYRSMK